jgi:hypothetical protein
MDIKGNGLEVSVNPAQQSDEWLISAAQEIADVARERGLALPFATGVVAVEGATHDETETISDAEVPTPDTKESLRAQLGIARQGYQATVGALNGKLNKNNKLAAAELPHMYKEFDAWLSEEKLAYVQATQEADPTVRFTLVATPNVLITPGHLIETAKAFGKNQPYETYVYDRLYDKYSAQQLLGTTPGNGKAVMFSLIPSTFTEGLEGTVAQQRAKLAELQTEYPDLKVSSVLEAVSYWHTLRAEAATLGRPRGLPLSGDGTFDQTYIRHFNLPEQRVGAWDYVPYSCVSGRGRPYLLDSVARYDRGARLSVG